ncbi:MAG: ribonuclease HII [Patescibacteria group bacterium]|nr:MAG: ribonuclease HII [Patescibacteria group bacterium]
MTVPRLKPPVLKKLFPDFSREYKLWGSGLRMVAGVDEVGRGAWAGPLFAAAVVFPPKVRLGTKLNDSKKLSPAKRVQLADLVKEKALSWAIGSAGVDFIESRGITAATQAAMRRALEGLKRKPEFVLVDYFKLNFWPEDRHRAVKFGDSLSASIAAASILAKVARDKLMVGLAASHPNYGFESHKGYGTKGHREKIHQFGLCEIHRRSFISEGHLKYNDESQS